MTIKPPVGKRATNRKTTPNKSFTQHRWLIWLLLPGIGIILIIDSQRSANSESTSVPYPIPSTSLTAFLSSTSGPPTATAMTAGTVAPLFTLMSLDGKSYQLQDFRGQDVVLNFWATWCPPCKLEMPLLQATSEHFKSQNIVVLGINDKEDPSVITPFIKDLKVTFPILLDPTEGAFANYQVYGLPTTYFIDKQGRLVDESIGPLTETTMTRYLDKLKAVDRQ